MCDNCGQEFATSLNVFEHKKQCVPEEKSKKKPVRKKAQNHLKEVCDICEN